MKKSLLLPSLFVIIASNAIADAQGKYKSCIACHGAEGEKKALNRSLIIKEMSRADFIASMKGYQDGTYGGPMKAMMAGQVKNLTDADIEALADYIVK
ncbi:c-type cytochrome [Sulfurospirillum sp. T05]|uniref:C-type cytochrome n=1 Tax=Sulfurospirillum tamanense TaxID=2813362 RepID=A0ABS2WRU8_9BACT|nr:c-type cytochrome [Sulfurospirillum tamanensis]MBN2964118.1 c-type cytochrome [Sulfurospirillum tamanensis]